MSAPESRRDGGFVLAFVVFMLFAISVASATGYLIVASEFSLSKHSSDGAEALTVARAGLERFVAEQQGVVDDTVSYALGNGIAVVTTRKLFEADSVTHYYFIKSEATVTDIFAPNTPARRVVGAYAVQRRRPLPHIATVLVSSEELEADWGGDIHGTDYNTALDCAGGGASDITGGIARIDIDWDQPSDYQGSPPWEVWGGSYSDMVDSIKVRYDVLSDPDLPVDFDGTWPNFASLPADSFPVIRMYGNIYPNLDGRGVLIVVGGKFDPQWSFEWDGIILAESVDDYIDGEIRGLLYGGLGANNIYDDVEVWGDYLYYSCPTYRANDSLSYLELVENSVFEIN